jgi:hypothetical protein
MKEQCLMYLRMENEQTTETGIKPNPLTYVEAISVESFTVPFDNEVFLQLSAVSKVKSSDIETVPPDISRRTNTGA